MNIDKEHTCPLCFGTSVLVRTVEHGYYDEYVVYCDDCDIELDTCELTEEKARKKWAELWDYRK